MEYRFQLGCRDMGGWVRVWLSEGEPTSDELPLYLTHQLTTWGRKNPHLVVRYVIPINRDGNTVELHAFYQRIHFDDISPMAHRRAIDDDGRPLGMEDE